jgi:hypothetical protein
LVLFFSSAAANSSEWTEKEINVAIANHTPIIPIRLDKSQYSDSVRLDLTGLDYIDLTVPEKNQAMINRLIKILKSRLGITEKPANKQDEAQKPSIVINKKGNTLFSDEEIKRSEGFKLVKKGFLKKYYCYVDSTTGQELFKDHYDGGDTHFKDGLACVKIKNHYGVIDMYGNIVIPATYSEYSKPNIFDNQVIRIDKKGKFGLWRDGKYLFPCDYDNIETISPGYYSLTKDSEWYIGNLKGQRSNPITRIHKSPYDNLIIKNQQLLIGLPGKIPELKIYDFMEVMEKECGVLYLDDQFATFPIDQVVKDNSGRIFACANGLWGEVNTCFLTLSDKISKTVHISLEIPFIYHSIEELKQYNG